ncbi:MAG: GH116 family glycosyl hydrolase [Saccharolobus sp.]|uniref:GH116 family glycosyl hydrolase n=1 Tax=Saccharolobus sp. TaxID=2100761 RepID=UPI0028CFA58A|nr:GH116 family glycosyl hydrolase [Saccharolobus sp.]MDT7862274.1 GH116 family glycosyl hydrolase [Saccharolobus sp.]
MKYTYSYVLDSGIPLGGIGTGSVEIRADGRLYEWTIFNNGGYAERQEIRYTYYLDEMSSFFAARQKDKVRVLQAFDYYYGGNPYTLPWLKPVRQTEFIGEPPIAYLKFLDDFTISMKAFSPFIPLDLKNSSLPAVIFKMTSEDVTEFLMGIKNPFNNGKVDFKENTLVLMGETDPKDPRHNGNLCIRVLGEDVFGRYTERFDFWNEFRGKGKLESKSGNGNYGIIGGRGNNVTFILTWYFPNHVLTNGERIGHFYENFFRNCEEVADYVELNMDYLEHKTTLFHDLLYNVKGIESWIADLVGSQLTTLIKTTWLGKDGFFGIWEGYFNTAETRKNDSFPYTGGPVHTALNTIDVLTYSIYTILVLFPELAKRIILQFKDKIIREGTPEHIIYSLAFEENRVKFLEKVLKDPSIPTNYNKLVLTIREIVKETGKDPRGRVPHFFTDSLRVDEYHRIDLNPEFVLMWYLISKMTGDKEFLKSVYEEAKEAIESTIRTQTFNGLIYHTLPAGLEWIRYVNSLFSNLPRGDTNSSFLLGINLIPLSIQTYDDWSMLGITSFTSILWIASLQAFNEASKILNIKEKYDYETSVKRLLEYLWNGEYFDLWYDPLSGFRDKACNASQLLGHWYATLLGFKFLEDEIIKSSLRAIIKYNLKEDEGLINGAYPSGIRGRYDNPLNIPATIQMDSPWSGVEFYFASHLIYEKMVKEGEEVLKGIYDRYKVAGNFWNHLEWGSHYLRPLSSITIIAAYEGIRYDGFTKTLTIDPAVGELEWILLLPTCWGRIKVNENIINIKIYHGKLDIIRLILPKIPREIRINNMKIDYEVKENEIVLNREILLGENEIMELSF